MSERCPCPFSGKCSEHRQSVQFGWQKHYPGLPVFQESCPWFAGMTESERFVEPPKEAA